MWSMDWAWWVNVCTGIHPSLQSNEFCRKGIYPGQASLFISLLPDSSRVSSTLYSSALCIFHIGSPFMFYVRQLRGEQLCGRRILCKFRGREKELISVGEVEQNAKRSKRSTCEQTGAADQGLPQLLHYHNTRKQHLACCYCSNLKTDWQDLQVLSLSSPWPLWPPSSLSTFGVNSCVRGLFADFSRIIWYYIYKSK